MLVRWCFPPPCSWSSSLYGFVGVVRLRCCPASAYGMSILPGFAVSICFNSGEVSQISLMLVYKYFDFMMPVFNSSSYPVRQVFERLLSVLKNVRCSVLSFFNKQISCWWTCKTGETRFTASFCSDSLRLQLIYTCFFFFNSVGVDSDQDNSVSVALINVCCSYVIGGK